MLDTVMLGAPCEAPRSGEYLDGAQHLVHIVHRFTHAHEHYVGQRLRVRYGEYLIDDAGRTQVAVIALTSCHAEPAPHPAPRLGGDAESGAVAVGDIHGLYVTAPGPACEVAFGREEILDSAVGRARRKPWSGASHGIILFEGRAGRLGQLGHLGDVGGAAHVEPACYLLGGERSQPYRGGHLLQLAERKAYEWLFGSGHMTKCEE